MLEPAHFCCLLGSLAHRVPASHDPASLCVDCVRAEGGSLRDVKCW